ncbi:aspartate aminotransferase family protein [Malonomonas rubra]|uniref:aspartate aminotransferase family protein n=1 Tax=Malonomonas rubra TaxID=57040 RepID=UPI0026F0AD19|nr:aspartate aminotransferase family protein [Malonomonas rubra]
MSKSQAWIDRGISHVAKTYGRYPLVADCGKGSWLLDIDGKQYLDFLAGVAVNNLGHCHPKVVRAIQEQAGKLLHCSNFYHIPQQIELAELLCEHSFGDRVFFCNSGAEANEAAIKLARKYSAENHNPERNEVITAKASFHGRTLAGISATGQDKVKEGFAPMLPGFTHVPFGDIEELRAAVGPNTCAIMLEPVQGEGGVNLPPAGYLQEVRELCDLNQLLLIFDEVQVGCGRTGSLFAYQQEGVEPDIMTLAKALAGGPPIGAMISREQHAVALGPGTHGSTFGGNPLMAAAALATMKVYLEDGVLENCIAMGNYLYGKLKEWQEKYDFIVDVRGRGLMLGMELNIEGGGFVITALERGLLINCTAGKVLRFVPPLTVNQEEIDQMLEILGGIFTDYQEKQND